MHIGEDEAGKTAEEEREALTVEQLVEGLKADYVERNYLWTGNIDAELYASDCTFTDPTLSFQVGSMLARSQGMILIAERKY